MRNIVSSRITEAREARSFSMEALADYAGVTKQSISKYERGIINPSSEVLQAISLTLNFPIDFFYKEDTASFATSSALFFRSRSNIAKKVKKACTYQIKWTDEIKNILESYVDFIDNHIPTINDNYDDLSLDDIEELALQMRKEWGLEDRPVGDLIGILENNGVLVSQFAVNNFCAFKGIDAFSSWKNGTPYILYHSIPKSAVRTRFSILHELGHLVLHSAVSDSDAVKKNVLDYADMQADRFAAAFLLPATSFPNDISGTSLASLEVIKRKWGAAFSTIIKRCETLDLLSENQLNYLKRQMTTKKYWHKEPLDDVLVINGPEMLRDAITLLLENNILTRDSFLSVSALPPEDLKSICALPDDFFVGYGSRRKPMLKVL